MKYDDLKGRIFFKKDYRKRILSELLYDPIFKIFNSRDIPSFCFGVESLLNLMYWDEIVIEEKLRFALFKLFDSFCVFDDEARRGSVDFFVLNIIFDSEVKNFIDFHTGELLEWEDVLREGGRNLGFSLIHSY